MQHYVCACVMRTKLKRKSYTLMESLVSPFITSAINILSPQHNIVPNKKKIHKISLSLSFKNREMMKIKFNIKK